MRAPAGRTVTGPIARLTTGNWTIVLLAAMATIATAASGISAQEADDQLSSLHQRIETTTGEGRKLDELIEETGS